MSDTEKPDWPQTPDGTIDWETVFEAPDAGIIPMLSQAPNKQILHKISTTVIRQLFTRKNDAIEVERFLKELDVYLGETEGSEDLPVMRESIINLLRRIKAGRIEKAAAYVAEKKKEAADDARKNRKKKQRSKRRAGEAQKKKLATIILVGASAAIFVVLAALTWFIFSDGLDALFDEQPDSFESSEPEKAVEESGEETVPPPEPEQPMTPQLELSEEGFPLGKMTTEMVAELGLNVMILERFFWSGRVVGGHASGTALIPVLIIKDPDMASRICGFGPKLIDSINIALNRAVPGGQKSDPDDMRHAGQVVMQMLNKTLGKSWVTDLYLLYNVDTRLLESAKKCQLIELE